MKRNPKKTFLIIATILIFIACILLFIFTDLHIYLIWLSAINIICFIFYGYDKLTAMTKHGRIPEIIFHLISVLGGFIGGFAGMFIFRHKIRKLSFIMFLLLGFIIHLLIYNYFFPLFEISLI